MSSAAIQYKTLFAVVAVSALAGAGLSSGRAVAASSFGPYEHACTKAGYVYSGTGRGSTQACQTQSPGLLDNDTLERLTRICVHVFKGTVSRTTVGNTDIFFCEP